MSSGISELTTTQRDFRDLPDLSLSHAHAVNVNLMLQLEKCGFYPKGGGRAALTVHSLEPGSALPAINLTERGDVTSISVSAFQAGNMNPNVADRMASAAEAALREVRPCHSTRSSLPDLAITSSFGFESRHTEEMHT